jgi:hypothetical protein
MTKKLFSALEFYANPANWTDAGQVNDQELFDTAMGKDLGALARKVLDESKQEEDWQPIETAPKDGRHVLLYCEYYGIGRCAWESWRNVWRSDDPNHGIGFPQPTHWMPLPAFPKDSIRAKNGER